MKIKKRRQTKMKIQTIKQLPDEIILLVVEMYVYNLKYRALRNYPMLFRPQIWHHPNGYMITSGMGVPAYRKKFVFSTWAFHAEIRANRVYRNCRLDELLFSDVEYWVDNRNDVLELLED
jgi:hypothetical protein